MPPWAGPPAARYGLARPADTIWRALIPAGDASLLSQFLLRPSGVRPYLAVHL